MVKRRLLSGREVCEILADHGFIEVGRRGSHAIMQKSEAESTLTIPVPRQPSTTVYHGKATDTVYSFFLSGMSQVRREPNLSVGTLMSIIRQSALPRALFDP